MNEHVRIIPSLQRKGPPVNDRVALVKYHIPHVHRYIVRPAVVPVHLQRPRLVDVLRDVYYGADDQRHPVHVRREDGAVGVHPRPVEGGGGELRARPPLQRGFDRVPHGLTEGTVQVDHLGGRRPVVGVRVPRGPRFVGDGLDGCEPLVPEFGEQGHRGGGRADLVKAELCVVEHARGLAQIHLDPLPFAIVALVSLGMVPLPAPRHEIVVEFAFRLRVRRIR
mmetsp:Transcript_15650/g.37582  ORF Transcript_15650/g.37582 Transcript_15650/m.37582 type:complete len:223 (-) Transcript_15650:420-1088(-)